MKKTGNAELFTARICWKDTNQPVLRIHNCIKQFDLNDGVITYRQEDGGVYKVYTSEVCYISYRPQKSEEQK